MTVDVRTRLGALAAMKDWHPFTAAVRDVALF